jgi:antitoxin component YwqK of YwqJK toxin-antitoxin module
MKRYLFIIGLLFLQSCSQQVDIGQIQLRNDLYFLVNVEKPFSGTIVSKYANGQIENIIKIKNGKPHGESKFFYENGQVKNTTPFKNGKKNGEQKEFFRNGSISEVANYKNGTLDGPRNSFYQNGQIKIKSINKNGNTEGLISAFFDTGSIKYERFYQNGLMLWEKEFAANGDTLVNIEMIDGKKNGKEIRFFEQNTYTTMGEIELSYNIDGDISHNLVWKNGLKTGVQKSYNKLGVLRKVENYKNGKLHGSSLERGFIEQNNCDPIWNETCQENIEYRTTEYIDGKKNGELIEYSHNGILSKTIFIDGVKNGPFEQYDVYYKGPRILLEGSYQNGEKNGLWKQYSYSFWLKNPGLIKEIFYRKGNVVYENDYAKYK